MSDKLLNSTTTMSKVISILVALLFIVVLVYPIVNSLSNQGSGEDVGHGDPLGASLGYYTALPTDAMTVDIACDGTNITLSGGYSASYPVHDMILMVSDTQSLVVQDGVMFYNDGTTTIPTESVTLTLDSSGLNGKVYEWVYFPTEDGTYGSFDEGVGRGVTVASYNGISVIVKDGKVVDSPTHVVLNPVTENGAMRGYEITGKESIISPIPKVDGLWKFYVKDGNAVIVGYTGTDAVSVLEIPSSVTADGKTYTVTEIESKHSYESIVENTNSITNATLTIPNTVKVIGNSAFYGCGFIGSLTIPDSVTVIGTSAFAGCTKFTGSLIIPNSVTEIGNSAFYRCIGCTSLTIGTSVQSIGDYAFNSCVGFAGSLTIPNSVTSIGDNAFEQCEKFTSLAIGSSVTYIGDNAFHNCKGFAGSLIIPDSVEYIGYSAFSYCIGFTGGTLTLGSSLKTISEGAFGSCHFSGTLTLPDSISDIGMKAFNGNTLTLPTEGDYTQDDWNFNIVNGEITLYKYNGTYNGTLNIPSHITVSGVSYPVTHIGNKITPILETSTNVDTTLTLPNTVTSIESSAFSLCMFLKGALVIPDSVKHIGGNAFSGCRFSSVTFGNSVESIGERAFTGSNISGSVIIPDSVVSIGKSAFSDCYSISGSLTLSNSLESIEKGTFYGCSFTGPLVIPDSVTTINDMAFDGCSGFTSLILGNSVKYIHHYAFESCEGFTGSLILPDSLEYIGSNAFVLCSGFTGSLVIPDSVKYINECAFDSCSGFDGSLVISDSVETIGEGAFQYTSFSSLVNCSSAVIYDLAFEEVPFQTALNIGDAGISGTISDTAEYKDVLSTASAVKKIGDGSESDGIGSVASTLVKLVPILLIVSLLLVFIVPMVYKPN